MTKAQIERDAFSQLLEVNTLEDEEPLDESQWASGSYMHIFEEFTPRTVDAIPQELSEVSCCSLCYAYNTIYTFFQCW